MPKRYTSYQNNPVSFLMRSHEFACSTIGTYINCSYSLQNDIEVLNNPNSIQSTVRCNFWELIGISETAFVDSLYFVVCNGHFSGIRDSLIFKWLLCKLMFLDFFVIYLATPNKIMMAVRITADGKIVILDLNGSTTEVICKVISTIYIFLV